MEDALVPKRKSFAASEKDKRLNPCFNGRCTRTLLFMDTARDGWCVLILVLMEDALVLEDGTVCLYAHYSRLNPCFNGRCTRTHAEVKNFEKAAIGLNPCFNGRCTRTLIAI